MIYNDRPQFKQIKVIYGSFKQTFKNNFVRTFILNFEYNTFNLQMYSLASFTTSITFLFVVSFPIIKTYLYVHLMSVTISYVVLKN